MEEKTYKIVIDAPDGMGDGLDQQQTAKPKGVSAKSALAMGIALASAKKVLSYATASVERYTGNSIAQRQLNEALTIGAMGIGFALNPIATGALLAVDTAINVAKATNDQKWENRRAEQMARRSGNYLSTTTR